jgi:hypothetical protein
MTDNKSSRHSCEQLDILQNVLDTIPNPVYVLDRQANVELRNRSARQQQHLFHAYTHIERLGNVLDCINALSCPDGCGGARNCRDCPIRETVAYALQGYGTSRKKVVFQLLADGEYHPIDLWITASALRYDGRDFVVLTVEDVSEFSNEAEMDHVCPAEESVEGDAKHDESHGTYIPADSAEEVISDQSSVISND